MARDADVTAGARAIAPQTAELDDTQLVLSDLINRVLDKGVVISGHVTISVADIDLVALDLRLLLTSVETAIAHGTDVAATARGS
jgi:hypothetical protein